MSVHMHGSWVLMAFGRGHIAELRDCASVQSHGFGVHAHGFKAQRVAD